MSPMSINLFFFTQNIKADVDGHKVQAAFSMQIKQMVIYIVRNQNDQISNLGYFYKPFIILLSLCLSWIIFPPPTLKGKNRPFLCFTKNGWSVERLGTLLLFGKRSNKSGLSVYKFCHRQWILWERESFVFVCEVGHASRIYTHTHTLTSSAWTQNNTAVK